MQTQQHRWRILAVCCLSLFIVGLDVTAVNVALPSIGRDLHAGISGLQWTVDAYTLVLASLLMLAGSTADRLGRKRVFVAGLVVFSLASLLCSLAPNVELLVAFRVLQAVGGSMLNPVAMSIIANTFTDPRERAQAVGIWGAVFGISMALGPIVGGTIVDAFGWRPIFWINLPVGLAAIVADAAARPRVAGAAGAAVRPRRPGAGDRAAGGADLRDHRGARARMVVAGDRGRVRGVGGRARRPAGLRAAPRGAADRPAVLPLDARSRRRSRSRWPRSRRSAASCS